MDTIYPDWLADTLDGVGNITSCGDRAVKEAVADVLSAVADAIRVEHVDAADLDSLARRLSAETKEA